MTPANPSDVQIAMMSEPCVIDFANWFNAVMGVIDKQHIKRPAPISTSRVSQRFTSAHTAPAVTSAAAKSVQVMATLLF